MDAPLISPSAPLLPEWTCHERLQRTALFCFLRLQFPTFVLDEAVLLAHLERTYRLYRAKQSETLSWHAYLEGLYAQDWYVCVGCLERLEVAWETLFAARTGRTDCLLIDALRLRAARFYPNDPAAQEQTVQEFWSRLLVPDRPDTLPFLARYDGRRPLIPWLIRIFQNEQISRWRQNTDTSLEQDDHVVPADPRPLDASEGRWRELFVQAAREWLSQLADDDLLLLGLRWRYRLNQREAARLFGLNEGTLTRRTDKLRDRALEFLHRRLEAEGWTGEDLTPFILSELGQVLTDDPRLSADYLASLLARRQAGSVKP
ncbi:MAG: sigma-70 family RNA polymerase sigma factor [Gemmataceae bacterium]|nr:sigma-70 family RNA polymerase sigma factor [Gemmataceae bacterium]